MKKDTLAMLAVIPSVALFLWAWREKNRDISIGSKLGQKQ